MDQSSQIVGVFEAIPEIILAGRESQLAALLTITILVSILGYLLFRSDKSHYRAMVFIAVVAIGGFIVFGKSDQLDENRGLDNNSAPIEAQTQGTSEASEENNSANADVTRSGGGVVLPFIYGSDIYLGMTEQQLRAELPNLTFSGEVRQYKQYGGFAIYKELNTYDLISSTNSGGKLVKRYIFRGNSLVGVNLRHECNGESCSEKCTIAREELLPYFSLDGTGAVLSQERWASESWEQPGRLREASYEGIGYYSYALAFIDSVRSCGTRTYIFDPSLRN